MEEWVAILLPFVLLLARISAFFAVAPIFSWQPIPLRVRVAMVLLMTIFFAMIMPPKIFAVAVQPIQATVMITQEIVCGAALALVARLVYMGVQQGGRIAGRQMGLMLARVIDPSTGERSQPVGILFDFAFMALFLAAGGHHLLLIALARSYEAFPIGAAPNIAVLTDGVVTAGSVMLLFALKLSAPVLAAFLLLGVLLAVLARVLPEMNILMASLPLRVGLGLFMAAAILPFLDSFVVELAEWMNRFLIA